MNLPPREKPVLPRREFLKILSISGGALAGAWLLGGCGTRLVALETPVAVPAIPSSTTVPPATAVPTQTETSSATAALPLTEAPPATVAPPEVTTYLPRVDGSFSTFPLPAPRPDGWKPLLETLQERHSTRAFSRRELPVQVLADLLWAAFGVNRPQTGGRTAPSAYDVRDIDIYLATAAGLFRYEAEDHLLAALLPDDLRPDTGTQAFVSEAPLNLVYVSNGNKLAAASAQDREHWPWAHSGCIAQNVYLCCASQGLVTVVRSTIPRDRLVKSMQLGDNQQITLAQTIGYPAGT